MSKSYSFNCIARAYGEVTIPKVVRDLMKLEIGDYLYITIQKVKVPELAEVG